MFLRGIIAAVVATGFLSGSMVVAATFSVSGGTGCPTPRGFDQTQFNPPGTPLPTPQLSFEVSGTDLGCNSGASAIAGKGFVGGTARSNLNQETFGLSANSSYSAMAEYVMRVTIPDTWDGLSDIPLQVVAYGDAILSSGTFARTGGTADSAGAQVGFELFVQGSSESGSFPPRSLTTDSASVRSDGNKFTPTPAEDDLSFTTTMISDEIFVNPMADVRVRFTVTGSSLIFRGLGTAAVDSSNTFGFNPFGPAFILPEGFSISSQEASIVDNMWIDPRLPDPPSTVPLPAGLVLLASGLGILAVRGRKQA